MVVLLGVLAADDANWDLELLAILLVLSVVSELASTETPWQPLRISSGTAVIVVAMVFLGVAPAIMICLVTTLAEGARSRISRDDLLVNLVSFGIQGLVGGTLFHETLDATGIASDDWRFYALVFGLYALTLSINFAIVGGYTAYQDRVSFRYLLREAFLPVVPYDVLSAVVAVAISLAYVNLGLFALVVVASAVPALQYLVSKLILSMTREQELEESLARLEEVARTDLLTELPNARGANELLAMELERSRLAGVQAGLMIVDLDRFRIVNEELGTEAGDEMLREIARMLRATVRRIDSVARSGGSEFSVILAESGEHDVHLLAEQVLTRVREFSAGASPLSASIGVATFPVNGSTAEELMKHALQALEAARALGRDRVVVSSVEIREVLAGPDGRRPDGGSHLTTMVSLAQAVDSRDHRTAEHSTQVSMYAAAIARELGLNPFRVERVRLAGLLHDIGKVGVADEILYKAGPLRESEWEEIRRQPDIAARILGARELADIRGWILACHERPDGSGYPRGLVGAEIPIEAQMVAVADAYASMRSDSAYRSRLSEQAARAELRANAGMQFAHEVVDALLRVLDDSDLEASVLSVSQT